VTERGQGFAMERKKRTALILASIVVALFVGTVLKYWLLR
jgi:hypothetical protein